MNTASECFDKVKTDCFKFIKSQETSKEKFKGKEKMLKSFLIPYYLIKSLGSPRQWLSPQQKEGRRESNYGHSTNQYLMLLTS